MLSDLKGLRSCSLKACGVGSNLFYSRAWVEGFVGLGSWNYFGLRSVIMTR